jgi:mRNA interferase HigB
VTLALLFPIWEHWCLVVISRKAIREFGGKYSDAREPLAAWFTAVTNADWKNTAEVRQTFKDADFVGDKVIFNIAWNRYRLIAYITYRVRTVYIKAIITHKEYDKE